MLYNLEPADDLTGGPWYAEDNTLDEAFVNDLLEVVVLVVDKKSYPPAKKVPLPNGKVKYVTRFYQPTYRGYATAEDVYEYIINSKILQDDVKETFGVSQVHQLLEVACLGGSIHKRTDGVTYRSILPDYAILDHDDIDVYYNDDDLPRKMQRLCLDITGLQRLLVDGVLWFGFVGNRGRKLVLLIASIGMSGQVRLLQLSTFNGMKISLWLHQYRRGH